MNTEELKSKLEEAIVALRRKRFNLITGDYNVYYDGTSWRIRDGRRCCPIGAYLHHFNPQFPYKINSETINDEKLVGQAFAESVDITYEQAMSIIDAWDGETREDKHDPSYFDIGNDLFEKWYNQPRSSKITKHEINRLKKKLLK